MSKFKAIARGVFGERTLAAIAVPLIVMAVLFINERAWDLLLIVLVTIGAWEAVKILKGKLGQEVFYGRTKWFTLLLMLPFALMLMSYSWLRRQPDGFALCFQTCWIVWPFDVFALIGGKTVENVVGQTHKIAPGISPGKSWEGYMVGLAFGLLGVFLSPFVLRLLGHTAPLTLTGSMLLVVFALTFGHIGDFLKSSFKRWGGVKDSSRLLGGHGGILDRFDAFTFAGSAIMAFRLLGWL